MVKIRRVWYLIGGLLLGFILNFILLAANNQIIDDFENYEQFKTNQTGFIKQFLVNNCLDVSTNTANLILKEQQLTCKVSDCNEQKTECILKEVILE